MKPEQKRYPQQDKMKEQLSIKLLSGIKLIIHPDYKIGLDLLNEWINDAEELEHQNKELMEALKEANQQRMKLIAKIEELKTKK